MAAAFPHARVRHRPHPIPPGPPRREPPMRHEPARALPPLPPWPQPSLCEQAPQLCSNQIAQAIIALIDLGGALADLFTGVPRSLKSLEVMQRLANNLHRLVNSPNCFGKCLGAASIEGRLLENLYRLIQGGDVLSESGAGQRRLYNAIFKQAQQLAAEAGIPVRQAEHALTQAVFGDNDGPLHQIFLTLERQGLQPQPGPAGPIGPPGGGVGGGGAGGGGGAAAAGQFGGGLPEPETLAQFGEQVAVDITKCTEDCAGALLRGGPAAYAECVALCYAGKAVTAQQNPLTSFTRAGRALSNLLTGQPSQVPPGPPPSFQPRQIPPTSPPPLAPLIDRNQPCLECDGPERFKLLQQRQQVEQQIKTEIGQQIEQQIGQQQRELRQMQQLEQQPAEQRDIPQELARKQQLLEQIQSEIEQLQQEPQTALPEPTCVGPHCTISPMPEEDPLQKQCAEVCKGRIGLDYDNCLDVCFQRGGTLTARPVAPLIEPPINGGLLDKEAARRMELKAQLETKQGVTFCVGCQSQEDAILFLNGEPSSCSVIPGSTKALGGIAQ